MPIKRKSCTLSKVAPRLLNYVTDENFNVNYTLIPYTGVSIIDYRYNLKTAPNNDIWNTIEKACIEGDLKGLHAIQDKDTGPDAHQNSRFSSIIIKEHSYIRGNDIYLYAYFDNENSVNRYFDLINFISTSIS